MFDADTFARDVAKILRFPAGDHPLPMSIAERAMGLACFARGPGKDPSVHTVGAHWWQIQVPRGLTRSAEHWVFTRALAGWLLDREGIAWKGTRRHFELAEALVLPRDAMDLAAPVDIAERLTVPVVATLYRVGVVSEVETAIVGKRWSVVTGKQRRLPRDHATLSALATGTLRGLGVRRVVARGEPEVVLVAA